MESRHRRLVVATPVASDPVALGGRARVQDRRRIEVGERVERVEATLDMVDEIGAEIGRERPPEATGSLATGVATISR